MAGRGSAPGERRGGRKKGTPNKATAAREAAISASGLTPLEYMLSVMRSSPPAGASVRDMINHELMRMDAAKAAAPYVHPKLHAIEHTGKNGGPIETQELSEFERARR